MNPALSKIITGSAIGIAGILVAKIISRTVNWFDLKGKVILVSGGTRGLGLSLARILARKKAVVAVCGRGITGMEQVSEEITSSGGRFMYLQCDITDSLQVGRMFDEIERKLGNVSAVINNAGIMAVGPVETMTREDYEAAMKVHFWGPLNIINRALPAMRRNKSGRIVNIISVGGLISFPHMLPYNSSKFALSGFSEGLTAELSGYNIRVTSVYPGFMSTGSTVKAEMRGDQEREYAWFSRPANIRGIAMSPIKASKRIILAMQGGEKTITLSFYAKIAKVVRALFPALMITMFGFVNRLLPASEGAGYSTRYRKD
jgi:NAD(P)-dependent dehydrogenase (short-subunit alcohol dehydrogenase family)